MARASAAPSLTALGLTPLARGVVDREALGSELEALLRFHATLVRFPPLPHAPNATPIVALYDRGQLVGCAMSREPASGPSRLARAFLAASAAIDRAVPSLSAEVVYARRARWIDDPMTIEVGTEGIGLARASAPPVILMPQVARDHGADGAAFVALLRTKADGAMDRDARLVAWTALRVVARTDGVERASQQAGRASAASGRDYAAAWLARLIAHDGSMAFAIDARRRILQPRGDLHHARCAMVIEALARHGAHARELARARRWLGREIARALAGERVGEWPLACAPVASTLARALLAGIDVRTPLRALAVNPELAATPWHAAQVALALGKDTPPSMWRACVADLAREPFAPWTALAARAVGDAACHRHAVASVASCIRRARPYIGAASLSLAPPETGLTAVAAHALASSKEHRAVARAARAFVEDRQLLPGAIPASLDPTLALGAFAATPVDDLLRGDIVAHALHALLDAG
ncbi:MAG: hypothetical protein JWM74_1287 [Myxococcaceae bacterium]|nr:hypothetical protein [Myxococcaceae bacterium]